MLEKQMCWVRVHPDKALLEWAVFILKATPRGKYKFSLGKQYNNEERGEREKRNAARFLHSTHHEPPLRNSSAPVCAVQTHPELFLTTLHELQPDWEVEQGVGCPIPNGLGSGVFYSIGDICGISWWWMAFPRALPEPTMPVLILPALLGTSS